MNELSLGNMLRGDISKGIDFDKVFEKAVEIFSDQSLLDKKADEVSLKDLEISKAKANNFLDAVAGIMEIGHQVEVMSADKDKFRRSDELKVMNSLRRGCEMSAMMLEKGMGLVMRKMEEIEDMGGDMDIEQIMVLQGMLQVNIDASQKVVATLSRLVQLERVSGSRPWGFQRKNHSQVAVVEKLEGKADEGRKTGDAPREVTWSELKGLE